MESPATPTDMDISEGEGASCSTPITTTSTAPVMTTPISMMSTITVSTEKDYDDDNGDNDEAMVVLGFGAAASGSPVSMEQEFETLDASNGWPQAYLEVANRCHDYPYHVARALENRSRNRYRDVNPYDHSRVPLKETTPAPGGGFHPGLGLGLAEARPTYASSSTSSSIQDLGGQGDENNDYINASFVVVEEAQRSYILTQSPLPNTCGHFWLMVWQQNSRAVIMLNQLVEKESIKCSQYWPPHQGQTLLFEEIGIRVHMLGEEVNPYHTIRYMRLESRRSGEFRNISHFQYTNWPSCGVPESPASFLAFLFLVRQSNSLNCEEGPAVIHCSAGIGRSGTFALIDSCLVLMGKRENPFSLNIRQVLVSLRKYRMRLIQSPEQLRFSYMAIIEGAKFLMGDETIKKKWKELTKEDHARSYTFYTSLPPSGMIHKKYKPLRLVLDDDDEDEDEDEDEDDDDIDDFDDDDDDDDDDTDGESDYSDLAVRLPDSDDERPESASKKRGREECEATTSGNGDEERPVKARFKKKRLNPPDFE